MILFNYVCHRTDANNDDDELSYNLSLTSKRDKSDHTFSYSYTGIDRATKNYQNNSKNYYGYRDSINYIGNGTFDLDTKIVFGLENEFDKAKFQKIGLQIIWRVMKQYILSF